jgi:hypothetical protein
LFIVASAASFVSGSYSLDGDQPLIGGIKHVAGFLIHFPYAPAQQVSGEFNAQLACEVCPPKNSSPDDQPTSRPA